MAKEAGGGRGLEPITVSGVPSFVEEREVIFSRWLVEVEALLGVTWSARLHSTWHSDQH